MSEQIGVSQMLDLTRRRPGDALFEPDQAVRRLRAWKPSSATPSSRRSRPHACWRNANRHAR